ncbi:MAG: hypothetical protein HGB11_15710 [Chlorobiales bacterium]|nr:hypothetical protein [Chlorobiales bacterium]
MRKYFLLFAPLFVLVLLLGSPVLAGDAPFVKIVNNDGKLFGTLHQSGNNQTLVLTKPDGSEQEIGGCSDTVVNRMASPDGSLHALVVARNCGVTVDFATRILIEDASGQSIVAVFEGRPRILFAWIEKNKLAVHHSSGMTSSQIYQQVPKSRDIEIVFVADLDPVEATKYLDFSSYNYGITGRTAGIPQELLLRIAGWSQEASGLYRQEWGHWAGSAPYGDDPRGGANILNAIRYFDANYPSKK